MKRIEISILDADPLNIHDTLINLKQIGVTHLHLDIGDTSFIPNITMGMPVIKKILAYDFYFDLHFMVSNPLILIKQLAIPKSSTITVHYEISNFENVMHHIKSIGCKIGVAIKPKTTLKNLEVDKVLIMTVEPGHGGQKMIPECVKKIDLLRREFKGEIGIDGGVNIETLDDVIDADYFVVGSYFFNSQDHEACYHELLEKLSSSNFLKHPME